MKQKIIIFFISMLLFSVTGCKDHSDIESDIFVAGFAIDTADSSEFKYKISAEVITAQNSGDSANIETKVISAEGNTVLEALSTMVSESSKELYFDHCQILVIGKDVANQSLTDVLDLAFRDTDLRLSMKIIVAKNCKAYEILDSNSVVNVIKSYEISETIKINSENVGFASDTAIFSLLNQLNDLPQSGVVPAYTVINDIAEEKMNILQGTALFKNDSFVGYMENKQSQFALMATGKFQKGDISCFIPSHDQLMTVHINKCKRSVKTKTDGKFAEISLIFDFEVSLPEIPSKIDIKENYQNIIIENDISNYFEDNIYATVTDTINRYNTEIFGFSSILQIQQRDFCKKNAYRWNEILSNLKVKVKCNIKIKSSGITNDRIYKGNYN
ncbi:MAG: Ger(x)C family spore germination protein [Clostridia bacterium]|nr:Ger(x)C family spore germination protein [Clostridia bacterium]